MRRISSSVLGWRGRRRDKDGVVSIGKGLEIM